MTSNQPQPGSRARRLRRDLRLLTTDGACWAVMSGAAEWQFALFALAIGLSEVMAGLVGTVPLFVAAILQLVTPWGVRKVGSIRRWVWCCALVQALAIIPLIIGALLGAMPWWAVYAAVGLFNAAQFASAPPWQAWFTSLVPSSIRAPFVGLRNRFVQAGLAAGMLASLFLEYGAQQGWALMAFVGVFGVAMVARLISTACLAAQSDAEPGLVERLELPTLAVIRRHFSDRQTRQLLLYMLAFFFAVFTVAPYLVPYMRIQLGFDYWQVTTVLAVMLGVKAAVLPLVGRMAKKHGSFRVLWFGAIATVPLVTLWPLNDSFWYILTLQALAALAWACWETATFLLVFDIIPAERRTPVLTIYQLAQASAFLLGSLLGGAVLELVGVDRTGYIVLFVASGGMRFLALFILAGLEPSGLDLRHRTGRMLVRGVSLLPGAGLLGRSEGTIDRSGEEPFDRSDSE
ncbi:MAG: MFS transporter [Phycisphaerales bacterium]|nr:MFS transporter [Phycisphaerales bacterium]